MKNPIIFSIISVVLLYGVGIVSVMIRTPLGFIICVSLLAVQVFFMILAIVWTIDYVRKHQ